VPSLIEAVTGFGSNCAAVETARKDFVAIRNFTEGSTFFRQRISAHWPCQLTNASLSRFDGVNQRFAEMQISSFNDYYFAVNNGCNYLQNRLIGVILYPHAFIEQKSLFKAENKMAS